MCGIVGYLGDEEAAEIILNGLKRLEYRGYDSAGIVTLDSNFHVKKDKGEIKDIDEKLDFSSLKGDRGIGHTRWSTHGEVTKENAHPHLCCSGRVAIVHNGIIENHKELKRELQDHKFSSETDSEAVAHFFGERLEKGKEPKEVIEEFMREAEGTFAILVLDRETGKVYAMKRDSPLAIGTKNGDTFIGSDIYAFSNYTDQAAFFEDDEFAIIEKGDFKFYNSEGKKIEKETKEFDYGSQEEDIGDFDHWMIKEIKEQPEAVERLEKSLKLEQKDVVEKFAEMIQQHEKVIFVAAGTSYHASLLGVYLLQKAGIEAQALIASEFKNYERVDEDTLVIAVSQSGETMDTIESIKYSKNHGGTIASIVNVPHSTIQRESKISLEALAGQEKCVAATKTFTNQVYILLKLASLINSNIQYEGFSERLRKLIKNNEGKIKELAKKLKHEHDIYIIGRGSSYPVSREIALKLKEISYIHAEGMMGGELKHATLALIEEGTPVISLIPNKKDDILSNVKEVESRNAFSIRLSPHYGDFEIPENGETFSLMATTIGFLLAYYIAKENGLPIDKPRNLAKSVTVK